jgi:hypothetical protein
MICQRAIFCLNGDREYGPRGVPIHRLLSSAVTDSAHKSLTTAALFSERQNVLTTTNNIRREEGAADFPVPFLVAKSPGMHSLTLSLRD